MARLTDKQREHILADYHTGQYSQHKLAEMHKVSARTINKLVKGLEPKHTDKVNAMVNVKTALAEESTQEVNSVYQAVEKKTQHILLFQNSALRNQQKADKLLEKTDKLHEIEAHSRITQRNKETVLGKDKTIELTNVNAQQNNNSLEIEFK